MVYFDRNENVIEWSSEEIAIPYVSPWDNKIHRYYPDFLVKVLRACASAPPPFRSDSALEVGIKKIASCFYFRSTLAPSKDSV